jgi:hypothetical protein
MRRGPGALDADEAADFWRIARTNGSHWRRPWIGSSRSTSLVVAGIQVGEDRARLVSRGAGDLDDVLDLLARLLVDADVLAGRTELARLVARPVETRVRDVDAQIVALEHADAAHRNPGGGRPAIPGRLLGNQHRVGIAGSLVGHVVPGGALPELERRTGREGLHHRNVDPDRPGGRRNHELEPRTQARSRARDPAAIFVDGTTSANAHPAAEELDLQLDRQQHPIRP